MGLWDYIDWAKSKINPSDTGIGSEADLTIDKRTFNTKNINPDRSPVADLIVDSAYNRLNKDTVRPTALGTMRDEWTCADATCDIVTDAGIPWPADKSGIPSSSIDYVIDSFDGRGEPGRLFSEHSHNFNHVGPGELASGDILILDVTGSQKHMALITGIYEDGIEVVHDSGSSSPVYSKFYDLEFLNDNFDRAYRYNPNKDNEAFSNLIYNSK